LADAQAGAAAGPDWLIERRRAGAALAEELGLPTTKAKGWEFTDLSGLEGTVFEPALEGDPEARARADAVLNAPEEAPRVVQVDGLSLDGRLDSGGGEKPSDVVVASLDAAIERYPALIEERLGSLVAKDDPFVARNDAAWRGGAFIYVPAGKRLELPAQVAAVQDTAGTALGFRTLIILEEGAEAEVWEQWLATEDGGNGLFNTVTELWLGAAATPRSVPAPGRARAAGCSRPSAPRSSGTQPSTGSPSASARAGARSGWRPASPVPGPPPG
jgi:Fe-S cluster assembly protein SufD